MYFTSQQFSIFMATARSTGSCTAYFKDIWNMLEFTVLTAFYLSLYMRLSLYSSLFASPVIFEEAFYDFSVIGGLYKMSFNLDSVCVIALFFKLFKYAQLTPATAMLFSVLTRSAGDILYFLLLLFILLAAFSMMAMQFFGTAIQVTGRPTAP